MTFRRFWLSIVLAAAICPSLPPRSQAQQPAASNGTGARFGTRDPKSCPDRRAPEEGAISAEQAAIYVVCGPKGDSPKSVDDTAARTGEYLYLLDDVKVRIGKGRPFMPNDGFNAADIDPSQLVYPIQGSFASYQCSGTASDVKGRNCLVHIYSIGKGVCYRDTFGNWDCDLGGGEPGEMRQGVAGPR